MTEVDASSRGAVAPRSPEQRRREALERLARDTDVWVATADADGEPCLVPLAFWWDGEAVWLATRETNPTGRNLRDSGRARLTFGHPRDVVLMHCTARMFTREELPAGPGDGFVTKDGWDPRQDHPSYVFFRLVPHTLQAWGTRAEMKGRTLMRGGEWLVGDGGGPSAAAGASQAPAPAAAAEQPGWPDGLAVGATRTVRRCNRYQECVAFYRDVVGLPLVYLGETGPDGFGCAIFGLPGTRTTFELAEGLEPVAVDRREELVLYFPGEAARDAVAGRLTRAGHEPGEQYRYWELNDGVTFHDPDGRELVLVPWVFGEDTPPMRKRRAAAPDG